MYFCGGINNETDLYMDREDFRKRIKKELKKMSREQVVFFARLCAVRALPFIGVEGNFNYWKEKDREKYLYTLFQALDTNKYYSNAIDVAANTTAAADATVAIAKANVAVTDAVVAAAIAFATATAAAIAATNIVTDASVVNVIVTAVGAVDIAKYEMQNILLSDIKAIQKGNTVFNNNLDLEWYRKIWDNFQQALEKEDCKYWGDLYKNIFENNFKLDEEALERRMNVPKEIQEMGAAAVAIYLENLEEQEVIQLNEARIIILGEKGAGKTCLARRLINPDAEMTTDEESTAGVETTLWKLEQDDMNIHIWDFAGHAVTHAIHKFFLSERCLYILVYDGRTEGRNRLEYWLSQIKNYGGESEVFILVNKRDAHIPEIPINSLKDKYPIAGKEHYTLSIDKDKDLLDDFREDVIEYITKELFLPLPANWVKVKKKLERRFAENPEIEYINISEFIQIAKNNGTNDPSQLLKFLNNLGICFHYENMGDFDTLVLNPEWISHGIYSIINWVREQGGHSISITDFSDIFENNVIRYPEDKYQFLYDLMKRYELAYETEKRDCLIIPHLLHEDRPDTLPDFSGSESLKFRYKAEQPLPPNSISRFIVRHNKEIKKEEKKFLVWRYGVVLEDGNGSIALVREWENERMITIWVKGKNKTAYQDKLKETLNYIFDDIFKSNESEKPELQYGIIRSEPIPDKGEKLLPINLNVTRIKDDISLPADHIVTHVIKNIPFLDPITKQLIDLEPTAKAFNINVFNLYTPHFTTYHGENVTVDNSTQTFNFHNCNIDLQGNLKDLAGVLKRKGEIEDAEILEDAVEALSEVEQCKTPEEIKKKGIPNKLKRIAEDLGDKNSKLYKTVKGIKHGISIAQDIAKGYNDIAQWVGLPQVPKPFLGKE